MTGEEESKQIVTNIENSIIETHNTSNTTVSSLIGDASPTKEFMSPSAALAPSINLSKAFMSPTAALPPSVTLDISNINNDDGDTDEDNAAVNKNRKKYFGDRV